MKNNTTTEADKMAKQNFVFCEILADKYGKAKVPVILRELADIYERTML